MAELNEIPIEHNVPLPDQSKKIKPDDMDLSLNHLLSSPAVLASLPEYDMFEYPKLDREKWEVAYKVLGEVKMKIAEALLRQREQNSGLFVLNVVIDNGMLMSFEDKDDPNKTVTIFLSSSGKELSDWDFDNGGSISPERIKDHRITLHMRNKVSDNAWTVSMISMRTDPNFRYILTDPDKDEEFRALGVDPEAGWNTVNSPMYLLHFTEGFNEQTGVKEVLPLIRSPQDWLAVMSQMSDADFLGRLLMGKITPEEEEKIEKEFVVYAGETQLIDIESMQKSAMRLVSGKSESGLRKTPTSKSYLTDLHTQISNSRLRPIGQDVLPAPKSLMDIRGTAYTAWKTWVTSKILGE